jgi:hypothetical protein
MTTNSDDPTLIDPVTINILILADGRLRYDNFDVDRIKDDYSLYLMIEGLHQKAGPVVRFSTTTAFRLPKEHIRQSGNPEGPDSQGEGADIADFLFKCKDITENYDEVWIFGDQSETLKDGKPEKITTQLTACELCALQEFMDSGGGIFATGDHESLGASINAYVPRVRAMRVWRDGPGIKETTRYNTLKGSEGSPGGSEENPIPQQILPTLYKGFVHPLLDGPRGTIDVLPDHFHEGKCTDKLGEADLGEFPGQGNPMPIGVARSDRNRLTPEDRFTAIAAYDGHLAKVGRVVVDASFHHFVKSNLKVYLSEPVADPIAAATNTKTGIDAYEEIKTYHQNIAIWLAPQKKQREMFRRALWDVRWRSNLRGRLLLGGINDSKISPEQNADHISALGINAKDELTRLTSRSFVLLWAIETFKEVTADDARLSALYPWLRANESTPADIPAPVAAGSRDVIAAMIGGVLIEMAFRFPKRPERIISNLQQELEDIVRVGAQIGLRVLKPQ